MYSSFLPNYPPPLPLPLLVRPVSDGFAKPHLLRIECGPHRTLFLPLPCLRALNISTVNLSTGVRICWLLSSLTTTALVQSSIVSHVDFCNSFLPVSWRSSVTQSNVVFTKQSQWVFLKYKYEHLPLLLKSFSGFPFSSNRDQLSTSTLKALLPFHSSVPHHSSLAFCVLGILSSFSSSCMICSSLPPGLLFLLPGTSLASSLSCIQGDLLWRSGPNSHCTQ